LALFYLVPELKYHKPKTLQEALELMNELENAKPIAGGTDLIIDLKTGRIKLKNLVDISEIRELKKIELLEDEIVIGASTTLQELIENKSLKNMVPALIEAIENMGSWQIRNVATIGGNICNASPAADTAPPLMILNSKLKVKSIDGERIIPIEKFFHGPRQTDLKSNEILTEIIIPKRSCEMGMKFLKLGRRRAHTLSIVAVAVAVKMEDEIIRDIRISLNSVAPTPIRAYKTERELINSNINEIEDKIKILNEEIKPISDIRASAEYRREMSIRLTIDAIKLAFENWRMRK